MSFSSSSEYSLSGLCARLDDLSDSEPCDKCGGRRRKNCKPKRTASLGFQNYFKMFLCRFPEMDKCIALRKARCSYGNLSEDSKQIYRDLGAGFRCCPRRRALPVRSSCPKPKRKACKACEARRPRKCTPRRRARAKPCSPAYLSKEEGSLTSFVDGFLEYLKAKCAN